MVSDIVAGIVTIMGVGTMCWMFCYMVWRIFR